MGLFFSLLFVVTAYLTPETLFGSLAEYHIEIVIAVAAMLCSVFYIQDSGVARMPQSFAIFGLCVAVPFSLIFGDSWMGGAPPALMDFLPKAMAFFFIFLNCRKKIHLQILVALLFFSALFIVAHGCFAESTGEVTSPYLMTMRDGADMSLFRIRGLGFLNDPNDLAQFMVGLIPFLFLFWAKGRSVRNLFFVYLPVSFVIGGLYFTHSRGALLALLICCIIAGRRRFGTLKAVVVGGVLFVGLMAVGFTGGRDVTAGSDRMDAWSVGLVLFRTHPLFGVGYRMFTDHYEITAHNSVVVTSAELGLLGLISWLLLIVPTVRDVLVGSKSLERDQGADPQVGKRGVVYRAPREVAATARPSHSPVAFATAGSEWTLLRRSVLPGNSRPAAPDRKAGARDAMAAPSAREKLSNLRGSSVDTDSLADAEIQRMSRLMVVSIAGFLAAGWFLSRSYTMTLFVETGIAAAVYRISQDRGLSPPPWSLPYAVKLAALTALCLIVVIYIWLRIAHLMGA